MFEKAETAYAVCYTDAKINKSEKIKPKFIKASAEVLHYIGEAKFLFCGKETNWKDVDAFKKSFTVQSFTYFPWKYLGAERSREEVRLWHYERSKNPAETSREEERVWIYTKTPHFSLEEPFIDFKNKKPSSKTRARRSAWESHRHVDDVLMSAASSDSLSSENAGNKTSSAAEDSEDKCRGYDFGKFEFATNIEKSSSEIPIPSDYAFATSTGINSSETYSTEVNVLANSHLQDDYRSSPETSPERVTYIEKDDDSEFSSYKSTETLTMKEDSKNTAQKSETANTKVDDWLTLTDEQQEKEDHTKSSYHGGVKPRPKSVATSPDTVEKLPEARNFGVVLKTEEIQDLVPEVKWNTEKSQIAFSPELEEIKSDDGSILDSEAKNTTKNDEENIDFKDKPKYFKVKKSLFSNIAANNLEENNNVSRPSLYSQLASTPERYLFQRHIDLVILRRLQKELKLDYKRSPFSMIDLSDALPCDCLVGAWNMSDGEQLTRAVPHGKGRLETRGGMLIYLGEFNNGKRCGFGSALISASNDVYSQNGYYQGYWMNNCRHGTGTMTYLSGRQYNGQWYLDKMHGPGILSFADGSVLKGHFAGGKPDGGFTYYSNDGAVEHRDFADGQLIYARQVDETPWGETCSQKEHCKVVPTSTNVDFRTLSDAYLRTFRKETEFFIKHQLSAVKISCEEMLLNAKDELQSKMKNHRKNLDLMHTTDHNLEKDVGMVDSKIDTLSGRLDGIVELCRTVIDKQETSDQTLSSLSLSVADLDQLKGSLSYEKEVESLQREVEKLKKTNEKYEHFVKCQICHEKNQDCIIMPCMHMETCSACIARIRRVERDAKCPICRAAIQGEVIRKLPQQ